jgi:hypothetical protein
MLVLGTAMVAHIHNYVPVNGYVPDEKTAVAVAEAILVPIYGQQQVLQQRPFHAVPEGTAVWKVEGSIPIGRVGGVATVRLQRQDGRILSVTHGK